MSNQLKNITAHKQFGYLVMLITVFLGVALIFSGCVVKTTKQNSNGAASTNQNTNTNTLAQQVLFNRGNVAFSLQIPTNWTYERNVEDWTVTERTILLGVSSPSYTLNFTPTNGLDAVYSPVQLNVRYFNDGGLDLVAWYEAHKPELIVGYPDGQFTTSEQGLTINGRSAKSFQVTTQTIGSETDTTTPFYDRYAYLKDGSKIYELHVFGKPVLVERLTSTLNEIINSFKIEDPTSIPETKANTNANEVAYESPDGRYEITYPSDWQFVHDFKITKGASLLEVYVLDKEEDITLASWLSSRDKQSPDIEVLSEENVTVGGLSGARRTVPTMGDETKPSFDIYLDGGSTVFEIAGLATAETQAEVDQIVNSFRVVQ